jgi:hypothetical protein
MSKFAVALSILLILTGCSSMQSESGKGATQVNIPRPELLIEQLSSVPVAARHVEGGLPVQYHLTVLNHAGEPITLKQVNIVSMGYGAYDVPSTSRPFKSVVQPDQTSGVDFWVPANIAVGNASLVGANGPVTLRVTAYFDSPDGQFQQIVVQQVNANTGVDGARQ